MTPALLTSPSSRPYRLTTSSISAAAGPVTSACSAAPPIRAATSSAPERSRSTTTTRHPRSARTAAMPAPIPLPPPVTATTGEEFPAVTAGPG